MRLKTKLVLAITTLVFIIAAAESLIYASQMLNAAVKQSYDTNLMVAEQIRFALQHALVAGLRDQTVNPNDPGELRALMVTAVRSNDELQSMVHSVNLYSLTVYDINIGDSHSIALLSTSSGERRQTATQCDQITYSPQHKFLPVDPRWSSARQRSMT